MKNEDALLIIKQLIDLGVQKGIFSNADEVIQVTNAHNHIATSLLNNDKNVQVSDTTMTS